MNDHDTLSAVRAGLTDARDSLADVHLDTPATELVARASRRRRRRGLAAAGGGCAAIALAVGLALPAGSQGHPGSQGRQVHVHLAAWSVDSNGNGTVVVTVQQLTHANQLERALAEAGVPSIVTPGKNCLNQPDQKALDRSGALHSGKAGLTIHPAAIPHGAKILISLFYAKGKTAGFGWSLVHSGEHLRCVNVQNAYVRPAG